MKKIIVNYYLCAILFLIAQAIFVVAQGNMSITQIKKISAAEKENEKLGQEIRNLESSLAHLQSIENAKQQGDLSNYVSIGNRNLVSTKSLASN